MADPPTQTQTPRFRIGYALPQRKLEPFMLPSFIDHAKSHGLDFVPVNPAEPLTQQGPFHCLIHKLYGPDWTRQLDDFTAQNPNTVIIDPPSAVTRLVNRFTMLEPIAQLNIPGLKTPNQILIQDSSQDMNALKLNFPVIAKPLMADGRTSAHDLKLVFAPEGLVELKFDQPFVVQEFVNHGGVMFKVYVAGEYVKCVRRSSLPDVTGETVGEGGKVVSFSQISNSAVGEGEVEMPDEGFVAEVARGLREALGLRLMNFDMIKDGTGDGYVVIDVNYFPGFEKLPGYESVMTDFFLDLLKPEAAVAEVERAAEREKEDGGGEVA